MPGKYMNTHTVISLTNLIINSLNKTHFITI